MSFGRRRAEPRRTHRFRPSDGQQCNVPGADYDGKAQADDKRKEPVGGAADGQGLAAHLKREDLGQIQPHGGPFSSDGKTVEGYTRATRKEVKLSSLMPAPSRPPYTPQADLIKPHEAEERDERQPSQARVETAGLFFDLKDAGERKRADGHAANADEDENAAPCAVNEQHGHANKHHLSGNVGLEGAAAERKRAQSVFPHFDEANENAEKEGFVLAKTGIGENVLRVEIHSIDALWREVGERKGGVGRG